jgi:hypothetical protein
MSEVRQEALIEASVADVWDLVGDPRRYPEWWPRVIEVEGERFEEGDEYVQVTRSPSGEERTNFVIDRHEPLREIRMHCTLTGLFAHWRLTDAQGNTFVDVTLGMDPERTSLRLWDMALGRRYFRKWLAESVDGVRSRALSE